MEYLHSVGLNGRKDKKGSEKDKVDSFKEKGDKETKHTMNGGSKEKGGSGFSKIFSWYSGKK